MTAMLTMTRKPACRGAMPVFKWAISLLLLALGLGMGGCSSSDRVTGNGLYAYQLLGVSEIPSVHPMTGNPVGGLSGIAYDPVAQSWLVVSDRPDSPIAYTLRTSFDPRSESSGRAWVAGPFEAWLGREWPVPAQANDAESIAIRRSSFGDHERIWIYEKPPAIAIENMRSAEVRVLEIPSEVTDHYRFNLALEASAVHPDRYGDEIWAGLEAPLTIDGEPSGPDRGGLSRVLVYRASTGEYLRSYGYRCEPLPADFDLSDEAPEAMNTLVGLSALPDAQPRDPKLFLSLERAFQPGSGNRARVFALDGSAEEEPGTTLPALNKRPVIDFAAVDLSAWGLDHPENVEGIAIGPRIADRRGGRLVLIVTDDNMGRNDQKQIVYAFRVQLGR